MANYDYDDEYSDDEYSDDDDLDMEDPYGDGDEDPYGGEDPDPFDDEEGAQQEQEVQEESEEVEEKAHIKKSKLGGLFSKAEKALMKKEAILHECSPKAELCPCPICHKQSIFKSYRVFDWFPLLLVPRIWGVTLYRYYCFNKKCSRSWYRGYVFNTATPKFTPASVPTKRQFNVS